MEGTEEGGDRTDTRDPLRDTWMRYLGYANEVGEACRGLLPLTFVHATYGLVGLYVLADAAHKGHRASHRQHGSVAERRFDVADTVVDTLVWQTLASLLVPPLIINRACRLTSAGLGRFFPSSAYPAFTMRRRAMVQTAVGLSVIPLIVHPIDHAVHVALDHTTRSLSGLVRRTYLSTSPSPSSSSTASSPSDHETTE